MQREFLSGRLRPLDVSALRKEYASGRPFPFVLLDGFLEPGFARAVAAAYPTFGEARASGREFDLLAERRKVQVTDSARFPEPIKELNEVIASPAFLEDLSAITGIPALLADAELKGGGMHMTGSSGRLDVHVDFNFDKQRRLHRRLNLLLYLNPDWEKNWGGEVELWDADVKVRHHSLAPVCNRCLIFQTSEISYHGVAPVTCPENVARNSFATYFYTAAPPPAWDGTVHSTIFRARPSEWFRGKVLMPAERLRTRLRHRIIGSRRRIGSWFGDRPH